MSLILWAIVPGLPALLSPKDVSLCLTQWLKSNVNPWSYNWNKSLKRQSQLSSSWLLTTQIHFHSKKKNWRTNTTAFQAGSLFIIFICGLFLCVRDASQTNGKQLRSWNKRDDILEESQLIDGVSLSPSPSPCGFYIFSFPITKQEKVNDEGTTLAQPFHCTRPRRRENDKVMNTKQKEN